TRWPRDWSSDVCSSDLARVTVTADAEDVGACEMRLPGAARGRDAGPALDLRESDIGRGVGTGGDHSGPERRHGGNCHRSRRGARSEERRVGKGGGGGGG